MTKMHNVVARQIRIIFSEVIVSFVKQGKQINTELLFVWNDERRHQSMRMTAFITTQAMYRHSKTNTAHNKTAHIKAMMSERSLFTTVRTADIIKLYNSSFVGIQPLEFFFQDILDTTR